MDAIDQHDHYVDDQKLTKVQVDSGYLQAIKAISDRIVEAQRPIRILDAIKWQSEVKADFFANKFKELPKVNPEYYQTHNPLKFDLHAKREEFWTIQRDIMNVLGNLNPVSKLMSNMCAEYLQVLDLLDARGTNNFSLISQLLYGSSNDVFYSGAASLKDLADIVRNANNYLDTHHDLLVSDQDAILYTDQEAVDILNAKLNQYFAAHDRDIVVKTSDNIISDAAAGAEYLKIRSGANLSARTVKMLEVHEGWVHLGTTINGLSQPICTFLSKGTPRTTATQEGLAVIMEVFTFTSNPKRMIGLSDRVEAIHMAEQGANFLEVFEFFRQQGLDEDACYNKTMRVFRGSTPERGPFTKDLVYNRGFVMLYNFIRLAIKYGKINRLGLLFIGKIALEDLAIYEHLLAEKIIVLPKFIPSPFNDLAALSSWMCYSLFLNQLDLSRLEKDYSFILN